jgi:hypothetical protein
MPGPARSRESKFAAEAYINLFLDDGLPAPKDRDAVDKLNAPEKYVVGSRLVLGKQVLHHGRAPMDDINRLFKLRNRLVHPKLRLVRVRRHHLFDKPGYDDYNPEAAARFVTSVSAAVATLFEATEPANEPDRLIAYLSTTDDLLEYGQRPRTSLPRAPGPPPRFFDQLRLIRTFDEEGQVNPGST